MSQGRPQPLTGIVVLDLGQIYNGPYATLLMALAGAQVIKIERPGGENLRGRTRAAGDGAPFVMLNSNKTSATLRLDSERGRDLLMRMVERADVLVENFRPGVTDRLGIGPEVVRSRNPRLVYASSSGYGRSGRYRDLPAMDLTVQAMAGVMSITGYPDSPPVKAGPALADFFAGVHLYGGIVTALYDRERSGLGCVVETSMFEAVYPSMISSLALLLGSDTEAPQRTGNRHSGLAEAPYNVYPTADGFVAIICVTDTHWERLVEAMGRNDLKGNPAFATRRARCERIDEVDRAVSRFTSAIERATVVEMLQAADVPCAPVRDLREVVTDPHLIERGMLQRIIHPELGGVTVPHSPIRYEGVPRLPLQPSPGLGQHNVQVFCDWLGLSRRELRELQDAGVI